MFVYINHSSATFAYFLLVAVVVVIVVVVVVVVVVVIVVVVVVVAVLINLEITQRCREVVCIYVQLGGGGFTSDPYLAGF